MPSLTFSEPFLIPKNILSEAEQKVYEKIEKDRPEELKLRYKWWSLHDIMKYYHSGLIPIENEANFFSFKIDLTAPELLQNKYRDKDLVNGLDNAMSQLKEVTSAIAKYYIDAKAKWTTITSESMLNASMRRGGTRSRKNKKNTQCDGGGEGRAIFTANIDQDVSEAFSYEKLKNQCTLSLFDDVFHSRNRIFLVNSQMPTWTPETYDDLQGNADRLNEEKIKLAALGAAPPLAGGEMSNTRKTRKYKNKKVQRGKSRRMRK
jgi:hypothetical protein